MYMDSIGPRLGLVLSLDYGMDGMLGMHCMSHCLTIQRMCSLNTQEGGESYLQGKEKLYGQ